MKHIAALIILFFFSNAFGQRIEKDLYLKHSVRQDGLSSNFKVMDPDLKPPRYKKGKFYFWFKTQKIISTQGGASGSLLHGLYEAFYDTKQLAQKGEFKKGLKDGEWIYWRQNGTIIMSEEWKNGVLTGQQFLYDNKGQVTETIEYKRRSFSRKTADSLIITSQSKQKQTVYTFDSIGNVKTRAQFENGTQEGKAKYYDQGKLVKTEVYRKGKVEIKESKIKPEEKEKKPLFGKRKSDPKVKNEEAKPKKKWFEKKSEKSSKTNKNRKPEKNKPKDKKPFFDFFKLKKKASK